jgi:two-component system, chemotaxis family, chemotaxis protein CheY
MGAALLHLRLVAAKRVKFSIRLAYSSFPSCSVVLISASICRTASTVANNPLVISALSESLPSRRRESRFSPACVIDDSKLMRMASHRTLVRAGYSVLEAGDGEEGLRTAHHLKPDVIVLDMMLPKLDGAQGLRRLKQDPTTAEIPVVVLTSLSQRNEEKLRKDAAQAFIEEEHVIEDAQPLLHAVERLLIDIPTISPKLKRSS